ncbi:MAG: hypothetical protein WBO47_13090, partial [Gammaproteobacteria bacterium]
MPAAPLGRGLLTGPGGRGGVFDGAGLLTGPTARGSGFVTGPGREACWAGGDGRAAGADDCSADGPDFVAGLASVAVVAGLADGDGEGAVCAVAETVGGTGA